MTISLSLFSGCMGLDLGMELAGIEPVVAVEKDPVCRRTIQANRPDVILMDDICTVKGSAVKKLLGRHVDVVVGGPPCQSFSTIGKRGCVDDDRGKLILEYLRVLDEVRPTFLVMENVVGILSAQKDGKPLMPWLLQQFRRLGYVTNWWKLNSHDFGSPQKRLRVIITGGLKREVPRPVSCRAFVPTLGEAIGDMEDTPGECAKFSPKIASMMARVPEGGNWHSLPMKLQKVAMGNATLSSGGLTAFYRRLSYEKPCPTLLTSPTQRATTLCHPIHTRPLSVPEYKRIQGFSDTWVLAGSTSQKYRQLGNAVPVALAEAIGRSIVGLA